MPVIGIPVDHLNQLIGKDIERTELLGHLQHMGCDVEGLATLQRFKCLVCSHINEITENEDPPVACERCGYDFRADTSKRQQTDPIDVVRMELLAVRPDMFDVGGLARAIRGYLGIETGLAHYDMEPPRSTLNVESIVDSDKCSRPYIVAAKVYGIELDDDLIRIIMKMQENLHWALARNRKHASIGVYDLDTISGDITYGAVGPDELQFVPLGMADGTKMTPRGVLEDHPKGVAFAHLLESMQAYPLLRDSSGQVLSMPPIINSEETKVTDATTNLFIDVTGTIERIVHRTMNILVTSLKEICPNVRVEQVSVKYWDGRNTVTPNLAPQHMSISAEAANRLIGIDLSTDDVADHLEKMRHTITRDGDRLDVEIAAYRNDILHERDLQEDVAIAFGYHNIVPRLVKSMTVGKPLASEEFAKRTRRILEGLGYQETMTLMLISAERSFDILRQQPSTNHIVIAHPVSQEQSIVRDNLIFGAMETFSFNIHHDLPQRIFEVGKVSELAPDTETGAIDFFKTAAGVIGPKASFTEVKATCEALLRELGFILELSPAEHPTFIEGRVANVIARHGDRRVHLGILGEIHPEVLERFSLVQPISLFELDLRPLLER